jgi:hypothetical protein
VRTKANLPIARKSGAVSWHYDHAEKLADSVVHAVGILLGFIGAAAAVLIAVNSRRPADIASTAIYAGSGVADLTLVPKKFSDQTISGQFQLTAYAHLSRYRWLEW